MIVKHLYLEVTRACNQRCVQCYNNSGDALPNEMSTEQICKAVENFKRQGGERIQITGGEALYRRDIMEIFGAIRDCAFDHVGLSTNGMLFNEKYADLLEPIVDEVGISLDGFREEHDFMRGVRSYDLVLRAIRLAAERDYSVYVCSCLNAKSIEELEPFVEMLADLNIDSLKIADIGLVGRKTTPDDMMIADERDRHVFGMINQLQMKFSGRLQIGQSFSRSPLQSKIDEDGVVCTPDGSIYPMLGYLPQAWQLGKAVPEWEIRDDVLARYHDACNRAMGTGIERIAEGGVVNWWTEIHREMELTPMSETVAR